MANNALANNAQAITSLFGSRLSSAYNSLRGELGVPQTATDTIEKLVDRIQTSAAVEDRRTAVLGLKGLCRDWKEVGQQCSNIGSDLSSAEPSYFLKLMLIDGYIGSW